MIAAAIARQHANLELVNPCEDPIDEGLLSTRYRGCMDVAMIGLMRDGLLRVKEAATLRWRAIEP